MADIEFISLSTNVQQLITSEQAWHYLIIPKSKKNNYLEFYIDEMQAVNEIQEELEMIFGTAVKLEKTASDIINKSLGKYYRKRRKKTSDKSIDISGKKSEDFLLNLIEEANSIGSSDIHIEIYEEKCRVRLRIDGKLVERYILNKNEYPALINKVKIKSNLDIAEKRLPQDGRIFFETGTDKFDIRVSILPTLHGEKIVMRLLSKDATDIDINKLGFSDIQLDNYLEGIKKPNGIILISGPTGSGKTTTLYATLKVLNKEHSNVITIEDPIEYTLEGINQVQLKESIGLTFASALRTFLRQDPDIIMLGEIRDSETAQMSIRASLTGHLVLSTIHTNNAWGTVSRLIDMGVPSFLLANTLSLSVAQRLVRILCPDCKEEKEFDINMFPKGFDPPEKVTSHFKAIGCENCYYTGYKGRKAVYEVIPIDHELASYIKNKNFDILETLKTKGIKQLSDGAFELFKNGETTIEEVYSMLINSY
ncbi:MAG: type II/IV secretion system protein [Bacteroidales bacterium]|nr:type II/IV secretion system protein [Bacteroidales bacterium]